MNLNGGYAMIKHNATQEELAVAYKTKRPVLLYDADHRAHWVQINEKVIETVDEETQETITTYEYSYELLNAIEALVDDSGNPRFIEGDGVPATIDGFTATYCKWSLSGTHLMLVLSGNIANTTELAVRNLASYKLPKYILDKVVPVVSDNLEEKQIAAFASNSTRQNLTILFYKEESAQELRIYNRVATTLTADRSFRVQFDLLIDSE